MLYFLLANCFISLFCRNDDSRAAKDKLKGVDSPTSGIHVQMRFSRDLLERCIIPSISDVFLFKDNIFLRNVVEASKRKDNSEYKGIQVASCTLTLTNCESIEYVKESLFLQGKIHCLIVYTLSYLSRLFQIVICSGIYLFSEVHLMMALSP